jgi:hypothetical protein
LGASAEQLTRGLLAWPEEIQAKTLAAILEAAPELRDDWGPEYVAWLVAEGSIPAADVAKTLTRFRKRVQLGVAGELPEIIGKGTYLGCLLRRLVTKAHKLPWAAFHRRATA